MVNLYIELFKSQASLCLNKSCQICLSNLIEY